ncbi:MAG: M20/M25/M40 family metallo-hydrolase [Cytophagaceae bacterium]|jgi:putative aminopeptidase FrvX|nr:M20/M25/M40 family metallo-hydrolase [Cytophagaceae bacterium]
MASQSYKLLETLCKIHAPSGNEGAMKAFILGYVKKNASKWKKKPRIIADGLQDGLMLVFGKPRTAVFAHMDSIGFTVRYDNHLVPIGGPVMKTGILLTGEDSAGVIQTRMVVDKEEHYVVCDSQRILDRGTELVFACNFRENETSIQSCYLDNRLGVYNALKLAETMENGVLCFSCWEEHGGGTVSIMAKLLAEKYKVTQALISDITWITEGVKPGEGVVISMRDRSIPRRSFVNKIIALAKKSKIPFQLEVEGSGGSDGKDLQASPYPFDWIFIGAAEEHVHSPDEKVNKKDIESMIKLYRYLMDKL